jgi:hypothetical protein
MLMLRDEIASAEAEARAEVFRGQQPDEQELQPGEQELLVK